MLVFRLAYSDPALWKPSPAQWHQPVCSPFLLLILNNWQMSVVNWCTTFGSKRVCITESFILCLNVLFTGNRSFCRPVVFYPADLYLYVTRIFSLSLLSLVSSCGLWKSCAVEAPYSLLYCFGGPRLLIPALRSWYLAIGSSRLVAIRQALQIINFLHI